MSSRFSLYFIISMIVLVFPLSSEAVAQMCIGSTRYVVRDENGKIMSLQEMEKMRVSVNGASLKLRKAFSSAEQGYYIYDYLTIRNQKLVRMPEGVFLQNPLVFGIDFSLTFCGALGDLTLERGGKQMRLIFDVREHNTSYLIESLPFQHGTFYLKSLKCSDGAPPPLIDNNNTGKCLVSADNWERTGKDWTRRLILNNFWEGEVDSRTACREKKIEVINNQKAWAEAWKLNKLKGNYSSIPAVDFTIEVVLVLYLPMKLRFDNAVMNSQGDLMLHTSRIGTALPINTDCNVTLVRIYRSGIKSIEGKALPRNMAKIAFQTKYGFLYIQQLSVFQTSTKGY